VNVDPAPCPPAVDPAVWRRVDMRRALAARDLAEVFRLLRRIGLSQRAIAKMAGLSPSEVYEILHGRQVMAYDVLCRICDGFGVPRGWLGLAYDSDTTALTTAADRCEPVTALAEVQSLLAHAAAVTMGVTSPNADRFSHVFDAATTPVPARIRNSDIQQIEHITAALRAMDYGCGEGACRDAVIAQTRWVSRLLHTQASDDVRQRLHLTLGDLHSLAGWTSMDVGLRQAARAHFAHALIQARTSRDTSLIANVLYRIGRLHLHDGMAAEALRFFQLGQIAAQESGCALTVAMLCATEAWAYAVLGDARQMTNFLGKAGDEVARAERDTSAVWVRFFSDVEITALTGMAHLALSYTRPAYVESARAILAQMLTARNTDMARSRAFDLTALATACLRDGDIDNGVCLGWKVAIVADRLSSARVTDRLRLLADAVRAKAKTSSDAADLYHHLSNLLPT
jgi:transcriptional regulator with XRE-family HTH domain